MKVNLTSVNVHVEGHFWRSGAVMNDTIDCGCEKLVVHFEVESPDEPAAVARVLRNSRKGCSCGGPWAFLSRTR